MITRLLQRLRTDGGSSIAAVMIVMLAVSAVGVGAMQTSQHTTNVSTVDRERVQAEAAAEAGVNDAIRRIQAGAGCDVSATAAQTLNDTTGSTGSFRTQILPEAGTTCGQTLERVIHAWGYPPNGNTRSLRHLEVTVDLAPQAGFPYALFADGNTGSILVKNSGTVTGDIYAENLDQSKNNINAQNIITPGSFTAQNNSVYSGTVWAAGNITLGNNSSVGKSVIASGTAPSSAGTITLGSNSVVGQDAIARSTVTLSNGAVIQGATSQNNPNTPPPPILHKPTFTWNPANYSPAPTTGTSAVITAALLASKAALHGTYYATDTGTIYVPSGSTVNGNLTIITNGKISVDGFMNASGGPWQVVLVALSTASDAFVPTSAFTASSGLDVLFFTAGGFDMKNNVTFKGAVYADTIDAKNTLTVTKSTSLYTNPPVGFTFDASSSTRYVAVPTLWREIVPGTPPA